MEHGPLPPHERTWRHPSELAAEQQAVLRAETSPVISRAVALTTGTIGLFAIAVLVFAMSPGDQPRPIAVSATTAPGGIALGDEGGVPTVASARGTAATSRPVAMAALATPIGEGRYALVSQAAIGDSTASTFDVTLPSGRVTVGQVVERSADTVLLVLSDTEPGHDVAERRPHDREVVTVMAEPPVTIAFADVPTLEVAEGTAVVDGEGNLVGLCTKSGQGRRVRLIAVDTEMATPDGGRTADGDGDRDDQQGVTTAATTADPTATDDDPEPDASTVNDTSDPTADDRTDTSEPSTTADSGPDPTSADDASGPTTTPLEHAR